MEFFAAIDKSESKFNTKGRNPIITLSKKEKEEEYWPRITKDKIKNSRITVDWGKWVDEDEEDEAPAMGGDFDPSMMSQFGGAGGMPSMGGMGGMPGMGGMGGMDMEAMMKQMGGMGGMTGGDSDDEEEEEAEGDPQPAADGLNDLDGEEEKKQ